MNELTFTYQRTKEDVLKASLWNRMFRRVLSKVFLVGFPIMGIIFTVMSFTIELGSLQYIAIGYLLFYPAITYIFIRARIEKIFKDPNIEFDITTYTFNKLGIRTQSDKGSFLLEWDLLYKVYNTKEYIYLFVDRVRNLQISKAHLGDDKSNDLLMIVKKYSIEGTLK